MYKNTDFFDPLKTVNRFFFKVVVIQPILKIFSKVQFWIENQKIHTRSYAHELHTFLFDPENLTFFYYSKF